jgi:hypothetical protein
MSALPSFSKTRSAEGALFVLWSIIQVFTELYAFACKSSATICK